MTAMRGDDLDWRSGRHGAYVWYANDELEEVLKEAFSMYLVENGLGVRVFHSIGGMEREVLAMVRGLTERTGGGSEHLHVGWDGEHFPGDLCSAGVGAGDKAGDHGTGIRRSPFGAPGIEQGGSSARPDGEARSCWR